MVINDHICLALPNPLNANFWPFEWYTQSEILMPIFYMTLEHNEKQCKALFSTLQFLYTITYYICYENVQSNIIFEVRLRNSTQFKA